MEGGREAENHTYNNSICITLGRGVRRARRGAAPEVEAGPPEGRHLLQHPGPLARLREPLPEGPARLQRVRTP